MDILPSEIKSHGGVQDRVLQTEKLLAGPIEIVIRHPQGFWLDITLGLGGLWGAGNGLANRPADSQISMRSE
jgi:hypothetical protein